LRITISKIEDMAKRDMGYDQFGGDTSKKGEGYDLLAGRIPASPLQQHAPYLNQFWKRGEGYKEFGNPDHRGVYHKPEESSLILTKPPKFADAPGYDEHGQPLIINARTKIKDGPLSGS
jgi:hypothetical protein